ncbi:core-2/I-branching enzyme-domain-containing protein [Pelagophyceae sp. CCMP2097]|nr:core-2/I-branching enzyme-domain-containing protein [Pelagophyceae sp. CCMP2097]
MLQLRRRALCLVGGAAVLWATALFAAASRAPHIAQRPPPRADFLDGPPARPPDGLRGARRAAAPPPGGEPPGAAPTDAGGPAWVAFGDVREVITAENGAWILPQSSFPRVSPGTGPDEFNDLLVAAITRELAKAWPPRVLAHLAQRLLARAFELDLELEASERSATRTRAALLAERAAADRVATERADAARAAADRAAAGAGAAGRRTARPASASRGSRDDGSDAPPDVSAPRGPGKVAFLFLVGGAVATEPIWKAFFAPEFAADRCSIHVHPPRGFVAARVMEAGAFFAPYALPQRQRVRVTWGSLAMVHAELVLLAVALREPRNSRFILLSEADVPLWPFRCTYDALASAPDMSFVESRPTNERWEMFDFDAINASWLAAPPTAETWRKGSQWFTLSRNHAKLLARKRHMVDWYDSFAKRQMLRPKLRRLGPLATARHFVAKPSFADEHFVQATLAQNGAEAGLVPVSLHFAAFGRKGEFTVWGNGKSAPFRLDAAEWHAVQFGALSFDLVDRLHELCAFDLEPRAPGGENAPLRRTPRGRFEPARLRCAFTSTPSNGTGAPCFLFARKLHSEAVNYYSEATATYFLQHLDDSLRPAFDAARDAQRSGARSEIRATLGGAGADAAPSGDYARADFDRIAAAMPDLFPPPANS